MSTTGSYLFARFADHPAPLPGIYLDRNWHLSSQPVWSRSLAATLAVSVEAFRDPVPLIVRLHVFNAKPTQPRTLTIASAGHPDQIVHVTTQDKISIKVMTPIHADGAQYSPITLALDTISSPIFDGISSDERYLGLEISGIEQATFVVETPIDCTVPERVAPVLGTGWADPDTDSGVWTLGTKAYLILPGYMKPSGLVRLTLDATILERPAEQPPLVIDLICDERPVTTWHLPPDNAGNLSCALPGWTENMDYRIRLQLTDVLPPAELELSSDTRLLGLHLRRITLSGT
jgi:hypothetical protein